MSLFLFVQATFNALPETGTDLSDGALLIGGDGRYYNDVAIQVRWKGEVGWRVHWWVGANGEFNFYKSLSVCLSDLPPALSTYSLTPR